MACLVGACCRTPPLHWDVLLGVLPPPPPGVSSRKEEARARASRPDEQHLFQACLDTSDRTDKLPFTDQFSRIPSRHTLCTQRICIDILEPADSSEGYKEVRSIPSPLGLRASMRKLSHRGIPGWMMLRPPLSAQQTCPRTP